MHVLSMCKNCMNEELTSHSLWLIRVGGVKLIVHSIPFFFLIVVWKTEGPGVNFVILELSFKNLHMDPVFYNNITTWGPKKKKIYSLYLCFIKIGPFWLWKVRFNTQYGGFQNRRRLICHLNGFIDKWMPNIFYSSRKHWTCKYSYTNVTLIRCL